MCILFIFSLRYLFGQQTSSKNFIRPLNISRIALLVHSLNKTFVSILKNLPIFGENYCKSIQKRHVFLAVS